MHEMARARGYGQFCPVAKAAEIVAERWTPLLLRELLCGSSRFTDLKRGLPLISSSLLSQRLRSLEAAGIVERHKSGTGNGTEYRLTDAGRELRPVVETLGHWGQRWVAYELKREDLDPSLLMWDMHRRIDLDAFPVTRANIHFELAGARQGMRRWWLLIDRNARDVDVCLKDPGFDIDMTVEATLGDMAEVWLGYTPVRQALRSGLVKLEGRRSLVQSFPRWIGRSVFAT